jgi:hypothetical protein
MNKGVAPGRKCPGDPGGGDHLRQSNRPVRQGSDALRRRPQSRAAPPWDWDCQPQPQRYTHPTPYPHPDAHPIGHAAARRGGQQPGS